jgi:hypothetical protein
MASKSTYEAQSPRALGRQHRLRLLYPFQSKLCGDVRCLAFFHERDKPCEHASRVSQLKTETSAQGEILLQSIAHGVHRPPPGHGRASDRNASISTRA